MKIKLSSPFPPLLLLAVVATQPTLASDRQPDSELLRSCPQCHGEGEAAIPGWPPLATMSKKELIDKLTTYRDGRVPESRMSDVTHQFSDEEIEHIAEHYAGSSD